MRHIRYLQYESKHPIYTAFKLTNVHRLYNFFEGQNNLPLQKTCRYVHKQVECHTFICSKITIIYHSITMENIELTYKIVFLYYLKHNRINFVLAGLKNCLSAHFHSCFFFNILFQLNYSTMFTF